jgi:ferredoxin
MNAHTAFIRETAAKLLAQGTVERVLGYRQGATPLRDAPFMARTPEEAGELVWSSHCLGNLAKPLIGLTGKSAVVAQGCVSRSLAVLLAENRARREDLVIIGVPCVGMVDPLKVLAELGGREPSAVEDTGETLHVTGPGVDKELKRQFMLRDNCHTCQHRNPVLHDFLAAEPGPGTGQGDLERAAGLWERLDAAGRFEQLQATYRDCVRCYACRDACPLCSCPTCFVDASDPQWVGKTQDFSEIATYHLLRAFHCAGRCTDCGACESACPQGLKVRRLTSKLERDVRALFGQEAGMDPQAPPPLAAWKTGDPGDFIK